MPRFKLTIAYDGRPFAGWQSQRGGNTIQDRVELAIAETLKGGDSPIRIHGAGRTDTGVHALGQVAHFDAPESSSLAAEDWFGALNSRLPDTIRIMECENVAGDFHARFSAVSKSYSYRIYRGPVLPPFHAGRAWHVRGRLDEAMLTAGIEAIRGRHRFSAFAATRRDATDHPEKQYRELFDVRLHVDGPIIDLSFTGNGFLYKMVRLLSGGLVHCARGREPLGWFLDLLNDPAGRKCTRCAPPDGLILRSVGY